MPEKQTLQRARQAKRAGKKPTTQASEFVREEMHHMKEGKHGPESREQAIAIGLSKARRAGVDLKGPAAGKSSRKKTASAGRRTTARKGTTARKSAPARKRTTRGSKTGGRTAAAGRTSRAKTASRKGTGRAKTASRSRSSSRAKK
jgi:Family of unknown function (DUF6496)